MEVEKTYVNGRKAKKPSSFYLKKSGEGKALSRPAHYAFWSEVMMNSVKEAPTEQMVFKLALEFSALLSQPTGTPWRIKLLSFYLVFV